VTCSELGFVAFSGHKPYKSADGKCVKRVPLNCEAAPTGGGGLWSDPSDTSLGVTDLACKAGELQCDL
jgi:hypothetical protein